MTSIVAAVVLGAVMCVAGGSKVAMGDRWAADAASMGAPRFVIPLLPWLEIGLGAMLIVQWQRTAITLVTAGLLASFTFLIASHLARGRRPRCACFGGWSARPLGWQHLVRNAILIACAVVAAI